MTQQDIENILKMRMAVYQAGVNAGCWTDIEQEKKTRKKKADAVQTEMNFE